MTRHRRGGSDRRSPEEGGWLAAPFYLVVVGGSLASVLLSVALGVWLLPSGVDSLAALICYSPPAAMLLFTIRLVRAVTVDSHGFTYRSGWSGTTYPWDSVRHVTLDDEGAVVYTTAGFIRIARRCSRFDAIVHRIQEELRERLGPHVPSLEPVPEGALSRATGTVDDDAERGISTVDAS